MFLWLIGVVFSVSVSSATCVEDRVEILGERISGDMQQQVSWVVGNVRIIQGKTRFSAARATIYLTEKRFLLIGHVRFENPRMMVRAGYLEYNLQQKTGCFREDVFLQYRMKSTKEGTEGEFIVLNGEQVHFDVNSQAMSVKSGRFQQADLSGGAECISYNDEHRELMLVGAAYLKKSDKDKIHSERIHIQLDVKSFIAEGNVTVSFEVDDGVSRLSGSPREEG